MPTPTALRQATTVAHAAAELAQTPWDEVAEGDLPAAAAELARAKAMLDAALLGLTDQLEATDAAEELGWASTKDFLTHVTGGHKGAGGGLLRAAQRTRDLPEVRNALAAGDISLPQARVIGNRVATLPRDPELRTAAAATMLDRIAQHGYDAGDLDRAFTGVVRELDPDGSLLGDDRKKELTERGAHQARHLAFSPDTVGGVRIKGYATAEEAEFVKAVLMPLAAPQTTEPGACGGDPTPRGKRDEHGRRTNRGCPDPTCGHDGNDPRESGARLWDALVEACDRLTATDSLPHSHGASARITVTTSYDDLRKQLAGTGLIPDDRPGEGRLPSGDSLSASAVRRLACDAEIIPAVLGAQGQVLDVGRTQRLVTAAIWLALVLRDQHCTFPGCTRLPIACDAHHIIHWADGGPTSLDNMVLLCRKHHTVAHQTPWQVNIDPHTRQPVWTPPPEINDTNRFTYFPARARPPSRAA